MKRRNDATDRARNEQEQKSFVPPCCPYEACPTRAGVDFRWVRNGWHETQRAPFRVQRFRCLGCRRTFSTQTFHYSYWQKRPELDRSIFLAARGCAGNRQIAAQAACGKSTVAEKIKRLARQAIRFQVSRLSQGPRFGGDLLFDGLGTFEHSQYHPYWLNISVHRDTSFVFGATESALRRSGTMRPAQKRKRERLEAIYGRPDGRAIRTGTAELLAAIRPYLELSDTRLVSDEHKAYPAAIRDAELGALPHLRIPGSAQRTAANPLFEINLVDMTVRHGQSSQKRETIAFNKRRQAGLERNWIWIVWKNFMAPRRVKSKAPPPAVLAGICDKRLAFEEIFGRRLLAWEVELPPAWARQVRRDIVTPQVGRNTRHEARFAT